MTMATQGAPVRHELRVALDYGQFYLYPATGAADEMSVDPSEVPEEVLEEALDGDGVAARGSLVVVLSPHQNNFDMRLVVEVWPERPPADLDDWQEVFEAHLEVGPAGITYDSPTLEPHVIPVPVGPHGLLISGKGFVAHGWPGSTEPGDEWRLQLWPDAAPVTPRRLRAWDGPSG